MKIAFICASKLPLPAVRGGGAETMVMHILNENEIQHKIDIHVLSYFNEEAFESSKKYEFSHFHFFKEKIIDKVFDFAFRLYRRVLLRRPAFKSSFIGYCCKKINSIGGFDYLVVEGNQMQVRTLKKRCKSKIVLHMHTDLLNSNTPNGSKIITCCDKIIAISEFCSKRIMEIGTKANIYILKNTIDKNLFSKRNNINPCLIDDIKTKINASLPTILFCGRLDEGKGLLQLLMALKDVEKDNEFNLIVVGGSIYSGDVETRYVKEVKKIASSFDSRIVFTGHVSQNNLPAFYSMADFVVFPSICNEAAGLITLESLSMGCPVITTNAGGIPEYAQKDSCIILNLGDSFVEDLTSSIKKMINDHKYYRALKFGAENFDLDYGPSNYYDRFIEILNA